MKIIEAAKVVKANLFVMVLVEGKAVPIYIGKPKNLQETNDANLKHYLMQEIISSEVIGEGVCFTVKEI